MKIERCPICNYPLNVKVSNGFELEFNKPLKELPFIIWCDNCKRKIKYDMKKVEKDD